MQPMKQIVSMKLLKATEGKIDIYVSFMVKLAFELMVKFTLY